MPQSNRAARAACGLARAHLPSRPMPTETSRPPAAAVPPPAAASAPAACVSCGALTDTPYCPRCGERRAADRRYSLRAFAAEAFETVTNADSTLWRTFVTLLR